jgi:CRISPR-associated protein Cmr3
MKIIISPNDVLLFREAKQFDAGETHVARSILPAPQALAGAIRSKILIDSDFSEDGLVGYELNSNEYKEPEFEILGSFFYDGQEYFRTPLDIAKSKYEEDYFYITPRELQWGYLFTINLFGGKRLHTEGGNGYLSYENMIAYLSGMLEERNLNKVVVESKKLFKKEGRVGIKLDAAKTTEEGYFYKVEFLRLNNDVKLNNEIKLALWLGEKAEVVEQHIEKRGMLKLGGESRFVKYELKEGKQLSQFQNKWESIKDTINTDKIFKLYIATTALVKENKKFTWDIEQIIKHKLGIEPLNIYSLLGKPYLISGWNYARNEPKGNKYGIPEGSVYFVEFEGEFNWAKPYLKFGELNKLGYGLAFLGVWKRDKPIIGDDRNV